MKTLKCGLIGGKLGHSYSKLIHDKFQKYDYDLISLDADEVDAFLKKGDFDGLNVTIPYKLTVIPYCTYLSDAAKRIGSVNTLVKTENGFEGYNTDYHGFLSMAKRAGIDFKDKNVVILGSGGTSLTARTVSADEGAKKITVVSRSGDTTYDMIDSLKDCEVLINTTPVGMYPNNGKSAVSLDSFPNCEAVLDVIYNPLRTPLLLQAKEKGLKYTGGLYMLVSQAAQAARHFCNEEICDEKVEEVFRSLALSVQNIVLVGMPGCGKTTIGREIAKKTGRKFIDTDDIIVERAEMSIPEIFEKYGEAYFRKLECEVVADFAKEKELVIATGGGAVINKLNSDALAENGRIYYIKRDISNLATKGRPLSKDANKLQEMFCKRDPIYRACADYEIENNSTTFSNTAQKILDEFFASTI
ncbi:MAG: AAA family ATPase [Clostridia bacterium]|nr:AAA family ATPase [Clostridia bacterium]